ncbi:hypothetical protein [Nostoc sp. CHAB 5836]|uniref:hypothetical protein n=1 Tax=Nostoc sp. CHAB 5836 TaxID=2780404 RepID=UPI001E2E5624|nr:hypothetical protein [Nostoc sp. CHAB 5836]
MPTPTAQILGRATWCLAAATALAPLSTSLTSTALTASPSTASQRLTTQAGLLVVPEMSTMTASLT